MESQEKINLKGEIGVLGLAANTVNLIIGADLVVDS
jgi:hypothetical protein